MDQVQRVQNFLRTLLVFAMIRLEDTVLLNKTADSFVPITTRHSSLKSGFFGTRYRMKSPGDPQISTDHADGYYIINFFFF